MSTQRERDLEGALALAISDFNVIAHNSEDRLIVGRANKAMERIQSVLTPMQAERRNNIGEVCNVPPAGWYCTRENGHSGPCASVEAE